MIKVIQKDCALGKSVDTTALWPCSPTKAFERKWYMATHSFVNGAVKGNYLKQLPNESSVSSLIGIDNCSEQKEDKASYCYFFPFIQFSIFTFGY